MSECCPFYEVRKLSFEEKITWVMSQQKDDLVDILSYHQSCRDQSILS